MKEIQRTIAIVASLLLAGATACTRDRVGVSPEPEPTPIAEPTPEPTPTPVEQAPSGVPSEPTPEPTRTPTPTPTPQLQPATVEAIACEMLMAQVDDPDPPLNVRSQPDPTQDNIVGTLENGTFLTVETEEDGWLKIVDPIEGWVAGNRTDNTCGEKVTRIEFPEGGGFTTLEDSFVGTGFHEYTFVGQAGETLTVESNEVLPFIIAPSGTEITGGAQMSEATTWTGTLPESGEYRLQMDSHFRGYDYELFVELK